MQAGIHPEYHHIGVKCSCGNQFTIGTVLSRDPLPVEVCNACHPFYTGKRKIIDTGGRVERFKGRFAHLGGPRPTPAAAAASGSKGKSTKSATKGKGKK